MLRGVPMSCCSVWISVEHFCTAQLQARLLLYLFIPYPASAFIEVPDPGIYTESAS